MAYSIINHRTKKALREAVAMHDVAVYQPGPFGPDVRDGSTVIEGPHFPEAHRFYAGVTVKNGAIPRGTKVK